MDDRFEHYDAIELPQRIIAQDVLLAIRRGETDAQIIADGAARGADAAGTARALSATRMFEAERKPPPWRAPGWALLILLGAGVLVMVFAMQQFGGEPDTARQQARLYGSYAAGVAVIGYGIWLKLAEMMR